MEFQGTEIEPLRTASWSECPCTDSLMEDRSCPGKEGVEEGLVSLYICNVMLGWVDFLEGEMV